MEKLKMDTVIITLIRTSLEGKVIGTASEVYPSCAFYEESSRFNDYVASLKEKVEEEK